MSISDPMADMLTKIRNASSAGKDKVDIPYSKMKLEVVKVLKNEGFIKNFKKAGDTPANTVIKIFLKYENDAPAIRGLESVSTPGRRTYTGYKEMPRIFNGFGVIVVSTSEGIVTGKNAVDKKIGGELICKVW